MKREKPPKYGGNHQEANMRSPRMREYRRAAGNIWTSALNATDKEFWAVPTSETTAPYSIPTFINEELAQAAQHKPTPEALAALGRARANARAIARLASPSPLKVLPDVEERAPVLKADSPWMIESWTSDGFTLHKPAPAPSCPVCAYEKSDKGGDEPWSDAQGICSQHQPKFSDRRPCPKCGDMDRKWWYSGYDEVREWCCGNSSCEWGPSDGEPEKEPDKPARSGGPQFVSPEHWMNSMIRQRSLGVGLTPPDRSSPSTS